MKSKITLAIAASCVCVGGLAHANATVTYTYDALGRLTGTQGPGGTGNGITQTFTYDSVGNRTLYQALIQVALSMNSPVVNLTATGADLAVNPSNPSAGGTVTFTENGTLLGSASVSNGRASVLVEGLTKGAYTITASYSGDFLGLAYRRDPWDRDLVRRAADCDLGAWNVWRVNGEHRL